MSLEELRQQYLDRFGKKAFGGWKEEELLKALDKEPVLDVPKFETKKVESTKDSSTEDRIKALEDALARKDQENDSLRNETQKLQEGWKDYESPVDKNKTATVKIYKEDEEQAPGVIIEAKVFKNNAFNEETRKNDKLLYTITVLDEKGDTKDYKIDAEDLSKIKEIEKVEIIKEKSRTLRKVQDYVVSASRDKDGFPKRMLGGGTGYGTSIGEGKVPLEVFMVKSTVTIRRISGQEFEMDSDNLNL